MRNFTWTTNKDVVNKLQVNLQIKMLEINY